jgi:hypothetical protein
LEELQLRNNGKIGNGTLSYLVRNKQLKFLDVNACNVTANAVVALKKALPDCRITYAGGTL